VTLDADADTAADLLPAPFRAWFAERGWAPRQHQLALLEKARERRSALLIAPTGAGKTLAGFLPSLVALHDRPRRTKRAGIHTLYVSPLKALSVDVARNLEAPVAEMRLPIRLETRTSDTSQGKRARQKVDPPDILMTTPEQVALLLASKEAPLLFERLDRVIVDELHALAPVKRGDLMALDIARLRGFAPDLVTVGLSATVAEPDVLRAWLVPQTGGDVLADLVELTGGARPDITILDYEGDELPWAGHTGAWAFGQVYEAIKRHKMSLIFVNTRSQAERTFQALWDLNEDTLPIALHHGSLDVSQRRKVEAAMAEGRLRAVVATSTLDLGIDWGDIDLVIHMGAPKGASRLAQRIGRANHRLDEPSRALLVPANRFEVLECRAALEAVAIGAQDAPVSRAGALDVLAQHVLGVAVAGPFDPDALYAEIVSVAPYARLSRDLFDQVVDFVATGGYALRAYERFAKLKRQPDGTMRLTHPRLAQAYRMNIGTIVEADMVKVRLVRGRGFKSGRATGPIGAGGRVLGEMEEWFVEQLVAGDTFVFGGEILRFEGMVKGEAYVSRSTVTDAKVPSYQGGKFPLSTFLADGVRALLSQPEGWSSLPTPVRTWLELQRWKSQLPGRDDLLVETFPRQGRHFLVLYPFEGRLAHQTLGMLLTRRLERARARPLGFVASDYSLGIWMLSDVERMVRTGALSLDRLLDPDMLGDDLDAWLAESNLMRRTFHYCAVIAGLVERRRPGEEKTGKQMHVSTSLVYDVLRTHEPDHLLLKAAFADAATGLLDVRRLSEMLTRVQGRIVYKPLETVSPLAVPILLDIGKELVPGTAAEDILREAADDLIRDATS
jgi:ATP-dependent Lhr-like helicase